MDVSKEEIKKDILDFYEKLMVKQQQLTNKGIGGNLSAGGNTGKIIAAYTMAVYGTKKNKLIPNE